jgi:hypothetical protein
VKKLLLLRAKVVYTTYQQLNNKEHKMNKDRVCAHGRYSDLAWFDEIEAAANQTISSWEKPAPKRQIQKPSIFGQLVKLIRGLTS